MRIHPIQSSLFSKGDVDFGIFDDILQSYEFFGGL